MVQLSKDDVTERYIRSLQGCEGVRLRTGSAGLLQDKRCSDYRCVMCDWRNGRC